MDTARDHERKPAPPAARWLAAMALLLLAPMAQAQESNPMQFHTSQYCRGQSCTSIVVATGDITPRTFDRFVGHIQGLDAAPSFVAFDSTGGNLGQALKMGVFIRALGLSTRVAPGSDCFSACVYAFVGGVSRQVDPGARMGVHQFSPESQDVQVTVEDTRQIIEGVSRYTQLMNISRHLDSLALMARPDQINLLTHDQVRMLGLDNTAPGLASVEFATHPGRVIISGTSMASDRLAALAITALPGHPGHVAVVSNLAEPGLYPRELMEKRMKNPGKIMICPVRDMDLSPVQACLFAPAGVQFHRVADGVYSAGFSIPAEDLARTLSGATRATIAVGPEGHGPLVSLVFDVLGIPGRVRAMASQ